MSLTCEHGEPFDSSDSCRLCEQAMPSDELSDAEQTEGAEVEALAKVLGDIRVAEARQADWWTDDAEHSLLIRVLRGECVPWAAGLLTSDWLAAREAAAEVRGAQAALLMAAIEVRVVRENGLPDGVDSHPTSEAFEDWLRARAARAAAAQPPRMARG